MKHFCYLLAFFSFVFCGIFSVQANSLSEATDNGELKPVIIRMKNQFDTKSFAQKRLSAFTGTAKRSKLVNSLKSFNSQSQESLMTLLKNEENNQEVSHIKAFWISNIVACKATDDAIEKIRKRDDVESVSLDKEQKLTNDEPTSEVKTEGNGTIAYNIEMARALEANAYGYTGKGVIVGVIDTGINADHEDLKGSFWTTTEYPNHGWNFMMNNDDTKDGNGHGTHCAGTIVGNGKAGTRTGVAPDAKLMILRVADDKGNGLQSNVFDAIEFATEHGANVLSMSMGFRGLSADERKTWRDAMVNLLEFDILAVIAAGNEGEWTSMYKVPDNLRYPGACPSAWIHPEQTLKGGTSSVITVGALSTTGNEKADLSSIGPVTWANIDSYNDYAYNPGMGLIKPDISSPGMSVVSADFENTKGYTQKNGTSMATPCVAGIVAAVLSKNPQLTPAEIVQIVSESSIKLAPAFNNQTGAGRADALLATLYAPNQGMNCKNITINETTGFKNGYLNLGDEAKLSFRFENASQEDITDYQLEIKCLSGTASVEANEIVLPALKAGTETEVDNAYTIKVLPETKISDLIDIAVIVKKGDQTWSNLFRLPITYALINKETMQIKELEGNENGKADNGETIELTLPIKSSGTEPCSKVNVSCESTSSNLTITETKPAYFEEITSGENIKLKCTISNEFPQWKAADFSLKLKGENIDTTLNYKLPVGKNGILIIDKSKNKLSSKAVKSYLDSQNYSYSYSDKLSSNLDSLKTNHSIWLFAGVYPNASPLTSAESEILSKYLQQGGYLYMEGGDLWFDNKATPVNKFFNIEGVKYNGGKINKILGCKAGYNESYEKAYSFVSIYTDQIAPIEPAFAFYKNQEPEYITTVAYNEGTYRTIGSSFELGGILTNEDNSPILNSYLDFFLMLKDGHFGTGIEETKQDSPLKISCFKSGNDYSVDISLPGSSLAIVNLYNSNGQLVYQIKENIVNFKNIRIPANNNKGIYFIKVNAGDETVAKKILF